ncbi:MAG: 16S rRNA (adenine(1518)-N(6)/adenine(1519)-N(6))-dimethyltransferase RsmA [Clostridia bacterium]|nr:16S rRNA (adenine(1518)-N(6)/adenine(1519)-N(6))-dimethyltransferase RsmA [Clostridia bacterium]
MSKTKERIRDSQLNYKHGLGQNFIYDEDLLASLAELSGVDETDDVLEIGPGSGNLTKHLCRRAKSVLSVELDERLIPLLGAFMAEYKNFTLVQGDVMQQNLHELTSHMDKPFSVVANIPYYITTPLITMLLNSGLPMKRLAFMVQKEVADKILAKPGDDGWGMLAVRAQYYCDPYLALDVPAACFTPPPKVDSAFVVLPVRETPAVAAKDEDTFFRVAGAAFALRRKTMLNNLCATFRMERADAAAIIQSAGLDERIRGEKLTLEELGRIADALYDRKQEAAE